MLERQNLSKQHIRLDIPGPVARGVMAARTELGKESRPAIHAQCCFDPGRVLGFKKAEEGERGTKTLGDKPW